jgi:hypothetical protein
VCVCGFGSLDPHRWSPSLNLHKCPRAPVVRRKGCVHAQQVKVKFGAAAMIWVETEKAARFTQRWNYLLNIYFHPSSAKSHHTLHTSKLYLLNKTTPTRDNKVIHEQDTKNNLSTRKLLGLITKETTTETELDRYSVNWNSQIYINNGKTNK